MPKVFPLTGTFVLLLCCEAVFSQANQGCIAFATTHDGVRGCQQRKPTQKATNTLGHTFRVFFLVISSLKVVIRVHLK